MLQMGRGAPGRLVSERGQAAVCTPEERRGKASVCLSLVFPVFSVSDKRGTLSKCINLLGTHFLFPPICNPKKNCGGNSGC